MKINIRKASPYVNYEHHLWADIVELIALLDKDGIVSQEGFLDYLELDVEDNQILEHEEIHRDEPASEVRERFASDIFKLVRARIGIFGEYYPFSLNDSVLYVNRDSKYIKTYSYFLLSSSIPFIEGSSSHNFTKDFEYFSKIALLEYLGRSFNVEIFGKGTNYAHENLRMGTKYVRFQKLAEMLSADFKGLETDSVLQQSSGDHGLDIVAYKHFPDSIQSFVILFGQCKCSRKWPKEVYSSSYNRFKKILEIHQEPLNVVFIPFSYRGTSTTWFSESTVTDFILFDRLRMLNFIGEVDWSRFAATNAHLDAFLAENQVIN